MLEHNVNSVRDWEVLSMKRREGQTSSIMFTRRLGKVTQLIDKVVDGLDRLNEEEMV